MDKSLSKESFNSGGFALGSDALGGQVTSDKMYDNLSSLQGNGDDR